VLLVVNRGAGGPGPLPRSAAPLCGPLLPLLVESCVVFSPFSVSFSACPEASVFLDASRDLGVPCQESRLFGFNVGGRGRFWFAVRSLVH